MMNNPGAAVYGGQATTAKIVSHSDRLTQMYERTQSILARLRAIEQTLNPQPEKPMDTVAEAGPYGIDSLTNVIDNNSVSILHSVDRIAEYLGAK